MAAIGDVMLLSFSGSWHGQRVLNTFYYAITGIVGAPTNAAFQAAFDTAISAGGNLQAKFLACCPVSYTLTERWIQTVAPLRLVKTINASGSPGSSAAPSTTANLAAVITRKGGVANRHNIGSLHVPYGNADFGMANGIIGGVQKVAMDALAAQMTQVVTVGGLGTVTPVLWFKPSILNVAPIIQANTQTTVRVMRRRTVGVGK